MSDTVRHLVTFIEFHIEDRAEDKICNYYKSLAYTDDSGLSLYLPVTTFEISEISNTSGIESKEVFIFGIPQDTTLMISLGSHLPYAKIKCIIFDAEVDTKTLQVTNKKFRFTGTLYKVYRKLFSDKLKLEFRNIKYYCDRVCGMPCTENCSAPYFGDTKICKADVVKRTYTVQNITGNNITVLDAVAEPAGVFNKGYVKKDGVIIGIRSWSSGSTFALELAAPADWLGQAVDVHYGCDHRRESCKNIHNNESRFMGAGYGMVEYDPLYSSS